ncbi:MAG: OmpA family protein [Hyphomicrobium sp.]|nr:OmpA family protein [Hyphomicrobium sp.]
MVGGRFGIAIGLLLLLAACAEPKYRKELVVLQPDADGKIGSVVVVDGANQFVLDQSTTAAHRNPGGKTEAVAVAGEDVQTLFGGALSARPLPPRNFRLNFVFNADTLTEESKIAFEGVFEDIRKRQHYDVEVVGHTDTKGTADYNARLSLQRAERIKTDLIGRGLAGDRIIATGRGEADLLVATPDETDQPLNRRVEITVR